MKKNLLKGLLLSCSVMVFLSSCVKDKYTGNQTADAGTSYVRITEAKVYNQFFSPFLTVKPVTMFSVRRDAANSSELASSRTVGLTDITAKTLTRTVAGAPVTKTLLDWYNTDHGTPYSPMPTTLYSVPTQSGITATTTGFNITFAGGEFAKGLVFNVDGNQVDLSKQYGIMYTISNTGGLTQKAGLDTVLATVAIKNKYDGVYEVTGTMTDALFPAYSHVNTLSTLVGVTPYQYELRTTSATTCDMYDNYSSGYGQGYGIVFNAAGSASAYGTFSPVFTFDLATDKITAITNHFGQPAANTRSGRLDPSGPVNAYESGKITVKYNMIQPSSVTTAPNVRVTWDEVWKYKKSR